MAQNPNAATIKAAQSMIQEEDLEALKSVQHELSSHVDKARSDGRVYLMSQYVRLVAMITPEIERIERRFNRDMLSSMRKEHVLLKQEQKAKALDANA